MEYDSRLQGNYVQTEGNSPETVINLPPYLGGESIPSFWELTFIYETTKDNIPKL